MNAKANAAGWVPSSLNRTAVSFSQQRPGVKPELQIRLATLGITISNLIQTSAYVSIQERLLISIFDFYQAFKQHGFNINSLFFFTCKIVI